MLKWDPQKRPSASQVLQHPYLANFVPGTKELISVGINQGFTSGMHKSGLYGSADEQHIKRSFGKENDYTTKRVHSEEDEHLEMLDNLVLEGVKLKDNSHKEFNAKKQDKTTNDWDAKPFQEENTDALLAEIEEYVNSDLAKQEGLQNYNSNKTTFNSNYSSNYQQSKPNLSSTLSTGNMKMPIGLAPKNAGMNDSYSKDVFDKSWTMGPSSYDLLQKNTPTYGKQSQFGQGMQMDNMYKYNGAYNNSNISNRGAQIMNTFVYSSNKPMGTNGNLGTNLSTANLKSKPDLNAGLGFGQMVDDGPEGFGKYGF